MTINEFDLLGEEKQAIILFKDGEFFGDIGYGNERRKMLYGLGNFYVEVLYNQDENVIEQFTAFSSLDLLKPYLEAIPLPEF